MKELIYSQKINTEDDVVLSRKIARQISFMIGLDSQDQARVATAVSEIARNVIKYSARGEIIFYLEGEPPELMLFSKIIDNGQGIADIRKILDGKALKTSSISGILIAKKLMDFFDIKTSPGKGSEVTLGKKLIRSLSRPEILTISSKVKKTIFRNPYEELQQQNKVC